MREKGATAVGETEILTTGEIPRQQNKGLKQKKPDQVADIGTLLIFVA